MQLLRCDCMRGARRDGPSIDPRGGLEEKGAYKGRLVGRELNVEVFFFFSPFFYLTGMSLGRF